jgi:hypothetical protein
MQKHRAPPKPIYYDTAPKGDCRYCGQPIYKKDGRINLRAGWHKDCIETYKLIYWPQETRKAVWKRDRGHCIGCGTKCGERGWDMDHIRPLIEAEGRIEFWMMDNLATLCHECHKKKTGSEASARAEARRAQKKQMGTTGTKPKKVRGRGKPDVK